MPGICTSVIRQARPSQAGDGQERLGRSEGGDSEVERRQQVAERVTHGLVVVDDGNGRRFGTSHGRKLLISGRVARKLYERLPLHCDLCSARSSAMRTRSASEPAPILRMAWPR